MSAVATLHNDPPRVRIRQGTFNPGAQVEMGPSSTLPLTAATIKAATYALQSRGWQPGTWYPGTDGTPGMVASCAVTPAAPSPAPEDALARVTEFLRQWTLNRGRNSQPDLIYGVHFDPDATRAELLASDLKALLAVVNGSGS